jgi:hypothetical protein
MPVAVWGNGADSKNILRLVDTTHIVCDDIVSYPRKRWCRRYYQRISKSGATGYLPQLTLDSAAFAQKIREPNRLYAVDEVVFPLLEGEIANLESAIPLVGNNDLPPDIRDSNGDQAFNIIYREWSEIVFAVAGNIDHSTATRFFNAVVARNIELANAGRPRAIRIAWEGYHTASVWGNYGTYSQVYNDIRIIDRAMLSKAAQFGLQSVSWMLQTATDNEEYAEINNAAHYCAAAYDPFGAKVAADEDAFYEALNAGWPVIGYWNPYMSDSSKFNANDCIKRAIRRKWPSGARDSV